MANLKMLGGGAVNGLVARLTETFTARTGLGIEGDFGAVGGMRDRVLAGEPIDAFLVTRALVDQLVESGHLVAESRADLGQVVCGVAVKAGAPAPDVASAETLREALLAADEIYAPDIKAATAGIHFFKVIEALGIAEAVSARFRDYPSGQVAMAAMARSEAANPIGCTQVTEILNTPGVDLAGALPQEHGLVTTYTAAVSTTARQPEAARTLIAILTDPDHAEIRAKAGFSE